MIRWISSQHPTSHQNCLRRWTTVKRMRELFDVSLSKEPLQCVRQRPWHAKVVLRKSLEKPENILN